MSIEAVFLDAGGVLTRLETPRPTVFLEAAHALGFAPPPEGVEGFYREIRRLQEEEPRRLVEEWGDVRTTVMAHGATTTGLGEAFPRVYREYRRRLQLPTHRSLYEDAPPTLEALSAQGVRLGVLSNALHELHDLLTGFRVASYFETIVATGDTAYEKPQREIFHHALDRFGLSPVKVVHVGDNYVFDYLGARNAGLQALLLDRQGRGPADASRIRSLGELPAALDL